MSEVPRYLVSRHHMHAWRENVMVTDHIGMVTYADHVAALAEAEQRVRDEERSHFQEAVWTFDRGHTQGRAEALRQAREAVAAVELDDDDLGWRVGKGASLDALDALAAGPEAGR